MDFTNYLKNYPDKDGRFGKYGGQYMPETLMNAVNQLEEAYLKYKDDPDFVQIAVDCKVECEQIFRSVAEQEKEWAKYLFKDGSMLGLNKEILCTYIEFITNIRMSAVGFEPIFESHSNPIPWINSWLSSDNVQVAPQEVEISSYLVGQIDSVVNPDDLDGFEL